MQMPLKCDLGVVVTVLAINQDGHAQICDGNAFIGMLSSKIR